MATSNLNLAKPLLARDCCMYNPNMNSIQAKGHTNERKTTLIIHIHAETDYIYGVT
jgi:hypothetical protein